MIPLRRRPSLRLAGYDYATPGAYFITICSWNRGNMFGRVRDGGMEDNVFGRCVRECWYEVPQHYDAVQLDAFCVMPNHVHGIVVVLGQPVRSLVGVVHARPLGHIVRSFKSAVTKRVNEIRGTPGARLWQRSYYDHIVRDSKSLERIRSYIESNPLRWQLDRENRYRMGRDEFDKWMNKKK